MKKILVILLLTVFYISSFAQGDVTMMAPVGSNPASANYNKQRNVYANIKAALTFNIPSGPSFSHNNSNPAVGNLFYNTTTNEFGVWNGSVWQIIGSSSAAAAWGNITGTLSSQTDLINALNAKQPTLVSGSNIATINGNNLLLGGNINISGGVTSVFGRTGAVVAQASDYSFYPLLSGSYVNPSWITSLAYSKITGVPAFLTSETDPLFDTKFSGKTTTNLAEGSNQYFTQARVSANTNVTANTAARHNAVTLGTSNGLSLSVQQLSLGLASNGVTGALSGADWNTFNAKQQQLVLTTNGTDGPASLIGPVLNIPNYATSGGAGNAALRVPVTLASNGTLIQITWATYSAAFGSVPTDLSLIELSSSGDRQVFTNWYSDDSGVTYKFDVAPETGSRNFVVVISGGSTVTSGNVTSVTSANGDISVTNSTSTPILTANTGTGANQIVKRNGSGVISDLAPYLQSAVAAITYQTLANLSTSTSLGTSDTNYPSQKAVKNYVDNKVASGQTIGANTTGNATTWSGAGSYDPAGNNQNLTNLMGFNSISQTWSYYGADAVWDLLNINDGSLLMNSVNGNASTATKLITARTINGVSFDGTTNITIPTGTVTSVTSSNSDITVTNPTSSPIITLASTISSNTTGKALATTLQDVTSSDGRTTNRIFVTGALANTQPTTRAIYMAQDPVGFGILESYNYANGTSNPLIINPSGGNVMVGTNTDNGAKLQVNGKISAATAPTNSTDVVRLQEISAGQTIGANTSGNAATSTILSTARNIGLSGVSSTPQSFNGSTNITIPITSVPTSLLTGIVSTSNGGAGNINGILKANGSGVVSQAVSGTDYTSPSEVDVNGTNNTIVRRDAFGRVVADRLVYNATSTNDGALTYIMGQSGTDKGIYRFTLPFVKAALDITTYSLPIASDSVLGGIKVGSGLSINSTTGVLSATGGGLVTASGTFAATATPVQNITSISVNGTSYSRVGNIVTYSGYITYSNTTAGAQIFTITLPVSSNFTVSQDVIGVSSENGSVFYAVGSGSNLITVSFPRSSASGSAGLWFTCQYVIK